MNKNNILTILAVLAAIPMFLTGCGDELLDPTQIGRFRPVPAVNIILDTLGVAEETAVIWKESEDPTPLDVMIYETDYPIGQGDVLQISIYELLGEGQLFTDQYIVTESGKIALPDVGTLQAQGLSEIQLENEIKRILLSDILIDPSVSVVLVNSQRRTFSIMGNGVPGPGRYEIPRYDFRLTDALSTAGGPAQFNVSYFYISRPITGEESLNEDSLDKSGAEKLEVPDDQMMEIIAPSANSNKNKGFVITAAEMASEDELVELAMPQGLETPEDTNAESQTPSNSLQGDENQEKWVFQDGKWVLVKPQQPQNTEINEPEQIISDRETIESPIDTDQAGRVEWVFQNGKWLPVQTGEPQAKRSIEPQADKREIAGDLESKVPDSFDWSEQMAAAKTRVIKIPADKLYSGDPRYNIIIRPGDSIHVPVDIIGEFCIMGNTNFTGFVNITGRPITLKMAIAAAGGLGPLAWPKKCEVTRRLNKNDSGFWREETVMVDLEKISKGEQPDFFIKPNDLINVGTHATSRWRAVLRNSFRAAYGFGFLYDRNFADRDYGTSRPFGWF